MKKMLLVAALALSGCGGGSDSPSSAALADPLIGKWKYVFGATQCEELIDFRTNGTYIYTSLDEVTTGNYAVAELGDRDQLTMQFESDNGLADCLGSSSDDTGVEAVWYVRVDDAGLHWYQTASGGAEEPEIYQRVE